MDLRQIIHGLAGPEQFAGLQQLTIQERIRRATDSSEHDIPNTGRPGEGFALQADRESFYFRHHAQATRAPPWRNEVTMSSVEMILDHAPRLFIDLIGSAPSSDDSREG
jgi:hypothetical protein